MNSQNIKSILILDDDENSLELTQRLISERININIQSTLYPTQASQLAEKMFFDIILIDITLNFNGSPFGGLELYKNLFPRYGDSSLLAYSQYIKDDLLKQYNYHFNFIEKGNNYQVFIEKIIGKISLLRKRQSCFIAMPLDKKYDKIYEIIKRCVIKSSYLPIRIDEQNFTKSIITKVFEEIRNSKVVLFFSIDKNPNVFYECGFAHALNKEIITLTDHFNNLPFDIRDRNAIAYADDILHLEDVLYNKLNTLTCIYSI